MGLGVGWAMEWTRRSAQVFTLHRWELDGLDAELGDGDLGENLDRGYREAAHRLDEVRADACPADVLQLVGSVLLCTVGGATGPLLGAGYAAAGEALAGREQLDSADVVELLSAARSGIAKRGHAVRGDKTMIDAWSPAVDAALDAMIAGEGPVRLLEVAAVAAEAGAAATEPLEAVRGRARLLGWRARGHRDPGAQSSALLIRTAAQAAAAPGPITPRRAERAEWTGHSE